MCELENKTVKTLIVLVILLILVVIGLMSYIVYDNYFSNDNEKQTENTNKDDNNEKDNVEENNKDDNNVEEKPELDSTEPTEEELNSVPLKNRLGKVETISLYGLKEYDLSPLYEKLYKTDHESIVSYRFTDITLNNKKIKLYINNFASTDSGCYDFENKYFRLYLNNKFLFDLDHEACYIVNIKQINILYDKYIAIYIVGEALNGTVYIYDENGSLVKEYEARGVKVVDDKYVLTKYRQSGSYYYIDEYTLKLENDKFTATRTKIGTKKYEYCDDCG